MTQASQPHRFPIAPCLAWTVALAMGMLAGGAVLVGRIVDIPLATQSFLLGGLLVIALQLPALMLVAIAGPAGVMPTVWAFFIGSGTRMFGSLALAAAILAVTSLHMQSLLLGLVCFYLPLLFVETGFVGRYLWQKDMLDRPPHDAADGSPDSSPLQEVTA